MHAVFAASSAAIIRFIEAVLAVWPHTPGALAHSESLYSLAEAVLSGGVQFEVHLDVLVTEDEVLPRSVEKHVSRVLNVTEGKGEG